ncbi:hypothetical protein [Siminovitchia sp. 179-K 8D1 HS]
MEDVNTLLHRRLIACYKTLGDIGFLRHTIKDEKVKRGLKTFLKIIMRI